MSSERDDQPETPEIHHGMPGRTLAAQREAMGWTVEQVADQLKLAVRQVVALEAGNYAALPSPAVVRGFVRAYAKILKIDAAPLVAMVEMDNPEPAESTTSTIRRDKPATFSESRFPSHGKRRSLPIGWILGVVVVVGATAVAWHLGMLLVPESLGGAAPTAHGSAASTTELAPPVTAPTHAAGSATPETMQNPSVPLISVPSQSADAAAGAGTPAAPAAAAATTAPVAAAAGPNALVISVQEDSWIEVRPAKGAALISRLVKAGSTETVQVNEPVTLVVGKPAGVSATLRGAAVELPLTPGKTTSRVALK